MKRFTNALTITLADNHWRRSTETLIHNTHNYITVLHRSQSLDEENVMHNKTGLLTNVKWKLSQVWVSWRGGGITRREGRSVLRWRGGSQKCEWACWDNEWNKRRGVGSHLKRGEMFYRKWSKAAWGRGKTRDFSASLRRVARRGRLGWWEWL